MKLKDKYSKISKDSLEIITENGLSELLKNKKNPNSYWGVAPTGPPHIGYYRAIAKQKDLLDSGFKHKILIANLHAYLDDQKSPWEETEIRGEVYKKSFEELGLKGSNIEYVLGNNIQLKDNYQKELLKAASLVSTKRARRAASEVVRMKNPKVSSLIYPIMQSLDCWALDTDLAYSGIDNKHVYMLASELLPKLGHKKPVFLFTPLGKGTSGGQKMSASEKNTRIELFAEPKDIKSKISKSFCKPGDIKNNPVLEYTKYLIFPRVESFIIKRPKKFGGNLEIRNYSELENKVKNNEIHPMDLKNACSEHLIEILKPLREYFKENKDLIKVFNKKENL